MKIQILFYLLLSNLLFAKNDTSVENLLQMIQTLEKRVGILEKEKLKTQEEFLLIEKKVNNANTASGSNIFIPQNEKEKKSFISKLRFELDSNKVKTKGPWTKNETWTHIKKNLSEFKVRTTLGNPTTIKSSNNPRVSRIYHYVGDLDADGELEKGYVYFYKGRSTLYKSPFE